MKQDSYALNTPFFSMTVSKNGRDIHIRVHDAVAKSEHHRALANYIMRLWESGVKELNASHVSFDYFNRNIKLDRGKRRLDIAYYKDNRLVECELKHKADLNIERTYQQLEDMVKHCHNLVLLVPGDTVAAFEDNLRDRNIQGVKVESYE